MKNLNVPEEDAVDTAYSSIKAVLNLIPVLGGTITEFFTYAFTAPIEKRRTQWMKIVSEALIELEKKQKGIVSELIKNEDFESHLFTSSLIALKTHKIEKHKQLKNALINSVSSNIDFDIQHIYINFIDSLTLTQVNILKSICMNESKLLSTNEYGEILKILNNNTKNKYKIPRMEITTFRFILKDLEAKGLLFISTEINEIKKQVYIGSTLALENGGKENEYPFVKVTEFGVQFLKFIEN